MLKKILQSDTVDKRLLIFSLVLGVGSGILLETGAVLESGGSVRQFGLKALLCILGYSLLFAVLNYVFLSRLTWKKEKRAGTGQDAFRRRWFLIVWLALFLCWIPVFLAYYPTLWAYDVPDQIPAIRGRIPSTHHPLLHTLYLETVVQIGSSPGNYETGMVLLSLTQMLALSGMFSYAIEFTRKWGSSKWCRRILFCFFAFFPVHSILSVSMTKDVLFSGCWLVCSVKLYDMIDSPDTFFHSKKKLVSFALFICLILALRSNAVYAFILGAILGAFVFYKNYRKQFVLLCLAGILASAVLQSGLFYAMHAEKGEAQEAFCVPMQCLVGTAIRHPELIPEYGTGEQLLGVVPRDLFPENLEDGYDPHLADLVKMRWLSFSAEEFDAVKLMKTWIAYGIKYPLDYVDIWGNLTLGAWYPLDTTHAEIYDKYEGARQGYLLTDYKYISEIGMERPASKCPWLENIYEKIATENIHQKIPVISLFFAPASYCWILFFCIALALYRRRCRELIPLGMLFFFWITVMLGPTVLVRYLYLVIVTVPFVLSRFCQASGRGK